MRRLSCGPHPCWMRTRRPKTLLLGLPGPPLLWSGFPLGRLLGGLALRRPLLRRLLRRFLLRGLLLPSLLLRSLLGLLGRFLLGGLLLRRFLRRCRGGGRH